MLCQECIQLTITQLVFPMAHRLTLLSSDPVAITRPDLVPKHIQVTQAPWATKSVTLKSIMTLDVKRWQALVIQEDALKRCLYPSESDHYSCDEWRSTKGTATVHSPAMTATGVNPDLTRGLLADDWRNLLCLGDDELRQKLQTVSCLILWWWD